MITNNIIKKPIITEKSLKDASKSVFTFEVFLSANKIEIKKAVGKLFKVHVVDVVTLIQKGKKKVVGKKRIKKQEPSRKKAYVQLKKGEKIDYFDVGKTT